MENLSRVHSDHSPILVHCGEHRAGRAHRPFRFVAAWADHPRYLDVVKNAWRSGNEDITRKLDRVRAESTTFNSEVFGDIFRRKRHIEARLKGVQRELNLRATSDLSQFEAHLQKEYRSVLRQEELIWYQKARDNRVRFGDRNTAYFHTQAVIRGKRKMIHRLKLASGEWCEDKRRLASEVS